MSKAKLLYERVEHEIPDVELPAVSYAETRGWLCHKLVSQTSRGWPDRMFMREGRVVWVEFKRKGCEPTEQQLQRHHDILMHGGEVRWFDDVDAFKVYFR